MFTKNTQQQPQKQSSTGSMIAMILVGAYIYSAGHGHAPLNSLIGSHTSISSSSDSESNTFSNSDSSALAMPTLPSLPSFSSKSTTSTFSSRNTTYEAQVYAADTTSTPEITSVYPDLSKTVQEATRAE